jgi:hypothetical protein
MVMFHGSGDGRAAIAKNHQWKHWLRETHSKQYSAGPLLKGGDTAYVKKYRIYANEGVTANSRDPDENK